MTPRVLVVAGFEPSGRAGLLADVAAIAQGKAAACAVPSALTAQGRKTFRMQPVEPGMLEAEIRALRELGPIAALKLGMVPTAQLLRRIRAAVRDVPKLPWVVDPVVRTSRGEPLSELRPKHYLALAGPNVVITPNAHEAAWLLGWPHPPEQVRDAVECAEALRERGFGAVVVKGGHLRDAPADVVAASDGVTVLGGRRLPRAEEVRGTGCRHASAMAAALAHGADVTRAARAGRALVARYLRAC